MIVSIIFTYHASDRECCSGTSRNQATWPAVVRACAPEMVGPQVVNLFAHDSCTAEHVVSLNISSSTNIL